MAVVLGVNDFDELRSKYFVETIYDSVCGKMCDADLLKKFRINVVGGKLWIVFKDS